MASTYTFTTKAADSEATGSKVLDHYMNQPIDGAHNAIQGIGNGIQTQDNTGTAVTSPATVASNSVTTLKTPESAIQITLVTVSNTLNICEVSSSMSTYFTLPTGTPITLDIADCASLYLEANTGNATVSFYYTMV